MDDTSSFLPADAPAAAELARQTTKPQVPAGATDEADASFSDPATQAENDSLRQQVSKLKAELELTSHQGMAYENLKKQLVQELDQLRLEKQAKDKTITALHEELKRQRLANENNPAQKLLYQRT